MRTRFQLRMQTLMVLVLVPTLLVVIACYGWSNYQAVYEVILGGFNRKLDAISSASAVFIDGDAHERLIVPRDVQAISYDSVRKRILGIDRGNGYLISLEPDTGSAEELAKLDREAPFAARSAAFDEKRDRLVVLLDDGVTVVTVGPEDGKVTPLMTLASPAGAVAFLPAKDELYFAGETLSRTPAAKPAVSTVGKLGLASLQGLVWDPAAENFIAIDSVSGAVYRVEAKDAQYRPVGNLIQDGNDSAVNIAEEEESKQWVEPQLVKLPAHGLALGGETPQLYTVTDRLLRVSAENGKGDPAGFRVGFRSDSSALYNKYVAPMRRVMADRELTYHYTTILPKRTSLFTSSTPPTARITPQQERKKRSIPANGSASSASSSPASRRKVKLNSSTSGAFSKSARLQSGTVVVRSSASSAPTSIFRRLTRKRASHSSRFSSSGPSR